MNEIAEKLINGQVGIMATDTLYGLVGQALDPKVVEKIYGLKRRNPLKPFIVLISGLRDLKKFDIDITPELRNDLNMYWPGPTSIILPCHDKKTAYLHRNTNTLAFRIPNKNDLIEILKKSGPLIAPSANPEGKPPAKTITEAKDYFGLRVDFYLDEGNLDNKPSTLIKILDGKIKTLRS